MDHATPLEIERKFLIRYPDRELLFAHYDITHYRIEQTYLQSAPGEVRRVRARTEDGTTEYFLTVKSANPGMIRTEEERQLTKAEYASLLEEQDPATRTIQKERLTFRYRGKVMELDLFAFWDDRAILEIELASEAETFDIPPEISVIREVTGERAYYNHALAQRLFNAKAVGSNPRKE